jgi:hypothetical protein
MSHDRLHHMQPLARPMTTNEDEVPPARGDRHEALAAFLGRWRAEGTTYRVPEQPEDEPRSASEPWVSTHTGYWHSGEFFLVQDERATTGGKPFDTFSVMGVDARSGLYFAWSFENHGFYRQYDVANDGRVWTVTGRSERARIEFSEDGRTQTITWEWRPKDQWLPLCDRVARRDD